MAGALIPLASGRLKSGPPDDFSDFSDPMDGEDFTASPSWGGSSGSSVASVSPKAESARRPNLDLSYFLSLANNPDMSSSSSESQSQGSRDETPPSDWHSTSWSDVDQAASDSWKWAGDSLMSDGVVDPSSLLQGNLGPDDIFSDAFDGSSIPHFSGNGLSAFSYENGVPSTTPSLYSVPQIVDPPTTAPMYPVPAAPSSSLDVESIGRRARELAGVQYAIQQTQRTTNYSPYNNPPVPAQMHNMTVRPTGPFSQHPPTAPVSTGIHSVPSPVNSSPSPIAEPRSDSGLGAPRPKTAHTTIERRYRTNLNARFVALRHAIPALRVLEKAKFPEEKSDEKGYVDGVKAARKASKGTILGKATEYIRVLKRRELRFRRELDGVKALVSGLVGGPELLIQWEREWMEWNSSAEQDEAGSDGDSDEEDGSDDDDDKPKKKAKATPTVKKEVAAKPVVPAAPASLATPAPPTAPAPGELKRKRGRPRKVQPTETQAADLTNAARPVAPPTYPYPTYEIPPPSHEGGRYLLGIFILFSFLNPFLDSSSTVSRPPSEHSHVGTVLTALNSTFLSHSAAQYVASSPSILGISWKQCVSYAHTAVSIALFLSVIVSIFPSTASFFRFKRPAVRSSDLASAIADGGRDDLRRALGCDEVGVQNVVPAVLRAMCSFLLAVTRKPTVPVGADCMDRQAWVRLAELELLEEESVSIVRRVYTSARLVSCLVSPSPSELVTLSLLSYPIAGPLSARVWSAAQDLSLSKHERILFDRSVEDAVELYRAGVEVLIMQDEKDTTDERITPLGLVAAGFVCGQLRSAASELFLNSVPVADFAGEDIRSQRNEETDMLEKVDLSEAVALGKGLTKPVQALVSLWEEVSADMAVTMMTPNWDGGRKENLLNDAKSFLEAIALYRHILSSPPSSPALSETSTLFAEACFDYSSPTTSGSSTPTEMSSAIPSIGDRVNLRGCGEAEATPRLALLRVLASPAFDRSAQTDEARDRLVDILRDQGRWKR